jgi:hypothetical protein
MANLPPGSTITQVELKFKAHRHGTEGTHCSFKLYDIKLPIENASAMYHAMDGETNWVLTGATETLGGEEWYTSSLVNEKLLEAIQAGINSGRNYVTFGFKREPEFGGATYWDMNTTYGGIESSVTLTVWFTPPQYSVQFKNDLDGASFGSITVNGNSIPSGNSFPLYWGDMATVTAYSGKYQYASNNWKFLSWTPGTPSDNQNPKNFAITDARSVVAYFEPVFNVTLRNDMEGSETGSLTYQGNTVSSGYTEPDVFRGSGRAFSVITPQTNVGVTWNFYEWSDGNTTPSRTEQVTSTMTYQAKFKGHRASNDPQGFLTNSQRKFIRDQANVLHCVYESSGSIWYTRSTTNGASWTQEQRINLFGSQAKGAAVTFSNDGFNNIFIAYQSDKSAQGLPIPGIVLSKFYNGQRQWDYDIASVPDYAFSSKPVVAAYSNVVLVIYKGSSTSGLSALECLLSSGNVVSTHAVATLPNTSAQSQNASVCLRPVTGGKYYVAYQQGDSAVRYLEWSMPAYQNSPGVTEYVSAGSGCSQNRCPSITINTYGSGTPILSWTGNTQYGTTAVIRRKTGSSWSSFYKAGGFMNYTNAIGTASSSQQAIIGWWNTYGNQTQFIRLINGSYETTIRNLPSPGDIQLSGGADFAVVKSIVTDNRVSPYRINALTYDFNYLHKEGLPDLRFGKEIIVERGGFELVSYLGEVRLDSSNVLFRSTNDVPTDATNRKSADTVVTEIFQLTPAKTLSFVRQLRSVRPELAASLLTGGEDVTFITELVSAENGRVIAGLENRSVRAQDLGASEDREYGVDGKTVPEGDYFLRFVVNASNAMAFTQADVQYEYVPQLMVRPKQAVEPEIEEVIREISLSQNYPNPFNPSTTIRFSVPQSSHVRVMIFNTLGEKVETLVDGEMEAGYHDVRFDASSLPSGVYIYQLRAGSFVEVRKMMLVK